VIRPQTAAISGSTGLAVGLAAAFQGLGAPRSAGRIKETLVEGPAGFEALLDELSARAKSRLVAAEDARANPAIVLPLDQAEELFNPDGAAEAGALLDLFSRVLMPAEERPARRILVVATIRSDRVIQYRIHSSGFAQWRGQCGSHF
jgi:hypothetical protein